MTSDPRKDPKSEQQIVIPLATDERCWFRCRQTNAGRVRAKEPLCSMFCYYSSKLPLIVTDAEASTKASTAAPTQLTPDVASPQPVAEVEGDPATRKWDALIHKYTFGPLCGKFLYFATGKPAVSRHLSSMRQVCALEREWVAEQLKAEEALEQDKGNWKAVQKPNPDATRRGLMILAYHRDYERIINVAYSIASTLASVHLHFEKIYGPTYKILSRLPSSFAQLADSQQTSVPTQFAMIDRLANRPLLSDSINLLTRSAESVSVVLSRLASKYASSLEAKDDSGEFGKSKRPPPPPSAPSST